MATLELFSYEACPYAQRTRMVLIEKAIPFSLIEVDLRNKPDWFNKLSPYGKVPLLRHDGHIVYESRIINEYIEEVFPAPALLPQAPGARATARAWIDFCDTYFMPDMHKLIADQGAPEKQIKNRQGVHNRLRFLEHEGFRKISDGPFFLGKNISLVDIQLMPFMERFPAYQEIWGASIPDDCTRLKAWIATMSERSSHQQTAKDFDFHIARYRQLFAAA